MARNITFLLAILFLNKTFAKNRIEKRVVQIDQVQRLYIKPGKPLYVEFPCAIDFALPGTKTDLEINVGIKKKNNLTFWAHSMSKVIGVNVKCDDHLIVFDIIPHLYKSQSFVKVTGITKGKSQKKRKLILKSDQMPPKSKKKRKLISKGGRS